MDEIITNLFVGDREDAERLGETVPEGWAVLAVTEYLNEIPKEPKGAVISPFMGYPPKSDEANVFILNSNAMKIQGWLEQKKKVLVHCSHGHERSPLQVAWFMVQFEHVKDLNQAYDLIESKHKSTARRIYWLPPVWRPYPYNGEVFK